MIKLNIVNDFYRKKSLFDKFSLSFLRDVLDRTKLLVIPREPFDFKAKILKERYD